MSCCIESKPPTENAVITVTTIYYGADPETMAGFVTTPLENAIAQANGIDYMTSISQSGVSTIMVYLRLNYDADKALTEINTKIASVLNQLPTGTLQPMLTVKIGQPIDAMYIGFNSDTLAPNQITDYLVRVVQPKLQAVPGVQTAELLGQKVFALRAWLDPQKLAAFAAFAVQHLVPGILRNAFEQFLEHLLGAVGPRVHRHAGVAPAGGAVAVHVGDGLERGRDSYGDGP